MKRALVTGAAGFVGQWLCRALIREGWDVVGASLTSPAIEGVLERSEHAAVQWMQADLREEASVSAVIDAAQPDAVFHLAGITFVPAGGQDPLGVCQANVCVAVALLHELQRRVAVGALNPTVLMIGSAEQYGVREAGGGLLREDQPCLPVTLYAASKLAQESFALQAARVGALRVVCTRSFNHSAVGQASHFLLPALVRRVQAVRAGESRAVTIGNAHTTRDFLHAEDVANAYLSLAERGVSGEVYNVCSGAGVTVEALAREVCARAGVDADIISEPTLRRAVDAPWLVGDHTKLRTTTGWTPRRSRSDIIDELLHAASH